MDEGAQPSDGAPLERARPEARDRSSDQPASDQPGDTAGSQEKRGRDAADSDTAPTKERSADSKTRDGKPGARDGKSAGQAAESGADSGRGETGSGASGRSDGAEGKAGDKPEKLTTLSGEKRTKVQSAFSARKSEAIVKDIDIDINVGILVPRQVTLYAVPEEVVVIVPAYRSYRYFIVDGKVVIVDPVTYEIVDVLILA